MDSNFEYIIKHLEFRGYRIEKSDNDLIYGFFNDHYPNIVGWRYQQGLRMSSGWNIREKKKDIINYYEYINKLNFFTLMGRFVDMNERLEYISFYAYPYDKAVFSNFIDIYLDDCKKLHDDSIGNVLDYIS